MSLQRPSHRVSSESESNIKLVLPCNRVFLQPRNQGGHKQDSTHSINQEHVTRETLTDKSELHRAQRDHQLFTEITFCHNQFVSFPTLPLLFYLVLLLPHAEFLGSLANIETTNQTSFRVLHFLKLHVKLKNLKGNCVSLSLQRSNKNYPLLSVIAMAYNFIFFQTFELLQKARL